MKRSLFFILFLTSLSSFSMDTTLNVSADLLPPDRVAQFLEITNSRGEKEFIKNPNYDWANWEKKTKSGEWDFSKSKPSGTEALEQTFGSDIYLKLAKSLGGTDSTLWSKVYWELASIYSKTDVWEEANLAKWKALVEYVLANGKTLGANALKEQAPTTTTSTAATAVASTTSSTTTPAATSTSSANAAAVTAAADVTGDHKTYYKEMIRSLKRVKSGITEKAAYIKASNKNLMDYKGKTVECSKIKTIATVTDAKIKTNCTELAKLEEEEARAKKNIDSVVKIQNSLPDADNAGTKAVAASASTNTSSSSNVAALATGGTTVSGKNCLLKVSDYSAWGFSKITMVGSGGSSTDNLTEREIQNGQTAYIGSESMTFQNPCINGSPWTDWASDSKIHSLYQKVKGVRSLSLVCRDGKMLTSSIRNRPEGTSVDSMLFGCNGKCEEEMVSCPDVSKTCLYAQVGNKNYLDGEEIVADFWSMNRYSASNLPFKLEEYGSAKNLDIVRAYAEVGMCKTGTSGFTVTKMGRFSCDATNNQWKYKEDVLKSESVTSRESLGGIAGLPQSMINQLPECSSKGVNLGETKTMDGMVVGTFMNPAVPAPRFLIIENPWNSSLTFDANGYQSMKGTLKKTSKQVFKGTSTHIPTGCSSNIPFELTLTFSSLDEAKYESVILEEGCGMTKGQVFKGVFAKVK